MLKELIVLVDGSLFIKGLSFAVFGGFVRVSVLFKGKKIQVYAIFCGILAASFIGAICMHLVEHFKLEQAMAKVISGVAGFLYPEMLSFLKSLYPFLQNKILKKLRLDNDKSE